MKQVTPEAGFRTELEKNVGKRIEKIFLQSSDSVEDKLENFPKYIKRQKLTRLLALYEIFKKIVSIKGSIVECGVYKGFGLMSWANISAVLEPTNITRRIYGFDSFAGFVDVEEKDQNEVMKPEKGQLSSGCYDELTELCKIYDSNRFLGHVNKVQLIKGDVAKTIPEFMEKNKHLVISLLFLDMDLYAPTKVALEYFVPRMPKGSIIAFDELDNPIWPGETIALLETLGIGKLKIERVDFDPYIGFAVID
ncbi:O-methyltransferase [Gammaproteobacteria bacterium]